MRAVTSKEKSITIIQKPPKKSFWKTLVQQKYLYLMSVPFVLLVIVFNYFPLWGWTMAFQNYKPALSLFQQEWVGFEHFIELFSDERFYRALRNTLGMSVLGLTVGFVMPIIFAVLLNEVRISIFKRTVQTITYLPHFVSWVVVAGIVTKMLSTDGGVINEMLVSLGILDKPTQFMAEGTYFWGIVVASDIWKEMGWNAIIFLAAISGIDSQLYEAAKVDGAGRLRQIWHVTLPGIRPTVLVLLILNIGHLTSIGFEKQMLLGNNLVVDYAEVLDLYALNYGIGLGRFSYGTAIGIFNSVISIILLFVANGIFKKYSNSSVM
ncbi:putative aldouronate transport system permease protein [Neobacillus niacini]|uniref:ABC transporter permease n=1 Tax=Neobacillus driksii TaxID=3035913 RepID=UPI0027892090|nr:sugar ABC transporter permease [Neobacillus niacini]MDQ0973243.1 putative aldouronate transport system permease protein [Neobacillus niacini]